MNKIIIITLVLIALIILFKLFNLQENIIILSSIIILLFLISLFNKNTYEKFQCDGEVQLSQNKNIDPDDINSLITIDEKTISIEAFTNIMNELKEIKMNE